MIKPRNNNTRFNCLLILALTLMTATPGAFGNTLIVTNLADSGPGTLRDRIAAANPGDTISFAVLGTVVLGSQLTISKNLFVYGSSGSLIKISGNNNSRVFDIAGGSVYLSNLAITDGRVVGANGADNFNGENVSGGGIRVATGATLQLFGCMVSNNVVVGGQAGSNAFGGNGFGGGIGNLGTLSLNACLVVSNASFGGSGGAVDGAGQAWGGALYTEGGVVITGTTIEANFATGGLGGGGNGTGAGGGIYNVGTTVVQASTIVSNAAASMGIDFGGAIDNYGTLTIRDSTIVGNQADYGGGITGGDIGNTILAGNSATTSGPDGSGTIVSSDYNLIQDATSITFSGTTTHNLTGLDPSLGPLQDNGGPVVNFAVKTLAPLPGSPVIDKGKNFLASDQRGYSRPYDGTIANASGGNGADIGAVEILPGYLVVLNNSDSGPGSLRQALSDNAGLGGGNTITFADTVTGTITLSSAGLTLAAPAIVSGPGAEVLAVSANHIGRVFTVFQGPSAITGLTIRDGLVTGSPGQGGQPNGDNAQGGGIFNQATLTISDCLILSNTVVGGVGADRQNGVVGQGGQGLGGGVYNDSGSLYLANTSLRGNRAQGGAGGNTSGGGGGGGDGGDGQNGFGGALYILGGASEITGCNFDSNLALGGSGGVGGGSSLGGNGGQGYGAGIYCESPVAIYNSTLHSGSAVGGSGGSGGTAGGNGSGYGGAIYNVIDLSLFSSTIASNSATGSSYDFGGGIYNVGSLGITNSTIAANTADYGGGLSGDAIAANTIFAGNTAGSGADVSGTINSRDYNLIQSFPGVSIIGSTTHTLVGQNPLLGPLQNNGGPTPTMALLSGSPAIDQGNSFGLTTDQRGLSRPYDLPSVANPGGGDGSDIGAVEFLPTPELHIQRANDGNVILSWSADAADFGLQSVTNLPATSPWSDVATPRVIIGNQVYTTNSAADPLRLYRLIFPID